MKSIEIIGRTAEEAIQNALRELNVTEEKVTIEVLEEGSKGFLNIIGVKPAKVKVTLKRDYIGDAKKFLREILNAMNVKAEIHVKEENNEININLVGPNMGVLIGYRGETLDSLQYLLSLVVNKNHDETYKRVILDTVNYRQNRQETLKKLALKMGDKVRINGKTLKLEPMNPYERRVIHSTLQNNAYVTTHSEGDEPYRRVVIELKKA
ncbi:DNA-binding protein [Clostridium sulfidigenes]|uniref:RNA-binding protein KhpB n=1 Tax=Clostridium sulfidigenes TaxID=318464 RepID=A0A084J7L3_9CLOT|nr:RNA-binding cell elongation regulator Jag/EloR [Clostridium sulfidigenes]HAR85408.1 protein jag [Clostridium sp.]HAY3874489.1 protein jag [Escherichia coli]KEZ84947.1 DNA-binding protein [Clostridium sulfidigenes]HAY3977448.1 protein jag [Escherichia coli]HBA05040.1 protein jag [Clostridium sp.]